MSRTFKASDIKSGFHTGGYIIDKYAPPMDMYTAWKVLPDGRWQSPKPICFHSLPVDGWIKTACNPPQTDNDKFLSEDGYSLLRDHAEALSLADFDDTAQVLDIGTGSGRMVRSLRALGYSVVSVDISPEVLERLKEKLEQDILKDVWLQTEDAAHMSFEDGGFVSIVCANALHEMPDPFAVLSDACRVCSTSGKLAIIEFNQIGYDLMNSFHVKIHGTPHRNGPKSEEITAWLREHFREVKTIKLPLTDLWIAEGKTSE